MKIERTLVVKIKNAQDIDEKDIPECLRSLTDSYEEFVEELKELIGSDEIEIMSDEVVFGENARSILKEEK